MATTPFSLRLDDDMRARLKSEAKQLHRSESSIAAIAIQKYLDACEQKRQAIDLSVTQADKGEFISSQSMNAWVDSWGSDDELPLPAVDVTK